ncbi:MFS transporter [Pendulispora albinea]|uniref:MFS transporter n=1 Tax=Pendulispora albinea TaxID=2741071 RepID=A0ABZ2LM48_9BACT
MSFDFRPLRRRDFRLLFVGQFVSFFGSMITYVALPYQMYQLTHSSLAVGSVGVVELVALLSTAFIGGAFADSMDRRKLLLGAESLLTLAALGLVINALLPEPSVWALYGIAAIMSALNGFHRPALEALSPRLVPPEEIGGVVALSSLHHTVGMIGGPALGGLLLAHAGLPWTFGVDVATFVISLGALAMMRGIPVPAEAAPPSFARVIEGFRYAASRQELLGTYIVDIVAVVFGMPTALFPALAEAHGWGSGIGWLYAAPSAGAFVATVTSGWTRSIRRHGLAIGIAASVWGLAIACVALTDRLGLVLFFLAAAGAADMVSGLFRGRIWNETIPDHLRGRLASIELVSYSSGPLLGNAEAGAAAALFGLRGSILSGGLLCIAGVAVCLYFLPRFARYDAEAYMASIGSAAR